jgi:hypothetical protein
MDPIRSKKISNKSQVQAPGNSKKSHMQGPKKIFISKLKDNEEKITPLSEGNNLEGEKNSDETIKGNVDSSKHIIYKVSNHPYPNSLRKCFRHALNVAT